MKQDIYGKLYDNIYKKSTLESIVINLETLAEKLKGSKKIALDVLKEHIDKSISNPLLKNILMEQVEANNMDTFSEKSLSTLIQKLQAMMDTTKVVDLSIALPLTEADSKELAELLEKKMNAKVILNLRVDPNLIAGFVLKQNKYIYDASLRNHLKGYENEWVKSLRKTHKEAEMEEVQA